MKNPRLTVRSGTQTVERAFALLTRVSESRDGATLQELSQAAHLHRTTTHRLVKCLIAEGALREAASKGRYVLGPLSLQLAIAAKQDLQLRDSFAPALTRLAELTGDTVFLMLRSGNDAVCLDLRLGSYPVKAIVVDIGTRRPLGIGAGSLAILSQLTDDEVRRIFDSNAERLSRYGVPPPVLMNAVRTARKAGYASFRVIGVSNVTAVGIPVSDAGGDVVAALSIAAIDARMSRARQAELVKLLRKEMRACLTQ
jgi:DNA-binding IclR family transcriptional regulator